MKTLARAVTTVAAALSLQSCVSVRPYAHEAKKNDGEIVVFCQSSDLTLGKVAKAISGKFVISLDGQNVTKLAIDEYVSFKVGVGDHLLGFEGGNNAQSAKSSVHIPERQTRYFKIKTNPNWNAANVATAPLAFIPFVNVARNALIISTVPQVLMVTTTPEEFSCTAGKLKERTAN